MKIMWTMMTAALAISFAGCATTSAANKQPVQRQATAEEYQVLVNALKEQNKALREQLARQPAPVRTEGQEPVEDQPPVRVRPQPVRPEDMVPPPAQQRRLPPQNWAWLHQPPAGCARGIYSMQVENQTSYHAQILLDGEELRVRGARGVLPGIPPGEVAYICLNNTGQHTFTGMLFALRFGQPQKVGRYRYQDTWDGASLWGDHRQRVQIRPLYVTWE